MRACGDNSRLYAYPIQSADENDSTAIDLHTRVFDNLSEDPLLMVSKTAYGLALRQIVGFSHRQLDMASKEIVLHGLVARSAVDMAPIVAIDVESAMVVAPSGRAITQMASNNRFHAAACSLAVCVTTPSKPKITAPNFSLEMVSCGSDQLRSVLFREAMKKSG